MFMRRAFARVLPLVGLWLLALFLAGCASHTPSTPASLRIMTYNIQHGAGLDQKIDLLRTSQTINAAHPDIVALQEVDQGVERTARRDLTAELAALTGMTGVFTNNFHYQGGNYGNAVLTRLPIKRWTNLHYKMIRPGEQRGLLQLVLDAHGREIVFMNTHIDYRADDTERLMNVAQIIETAKNYAPRPVVICGDFNDLPGSRTHRMMKQQFDDSWELAGKGDGLSYPAGTPHKRIDYIWIPKDKLLVPLTIEVIDTQASDHRPVVATFQLR